MAVDVSVLLSWSLWEPGGGEGGNGNRVRVHGAAGNESLRGWRCSGAVMVPFAPPILRVKSRRSEGDLGDGGYFLSLLLF